MLIRTKILLALSMVCIVAGAVLSTDKVIKPPIAPASYVILPAGAIFFGLFLLSKMLEKESVSYEEEKHHAQEVAERSGPPALATPTPSDGSEHTG